MAGLTADLRRAIPIVGVSVGAWLLLLLLWYLSLLWATSPKGHLVPLFILQSAVFALGLLSVPVLVAGTALLLSRRRGLAFVLFFSSLGILVAGVLLGPQVHEARDRRLHEFAVRSRVLVRAIETYEREKGHPPPDLHALVPGYLPTVPSTGMGAFPDYIYLTEDGGRWRLRVPVGVTPFEWEALEYRPSPGSPGPAARFDGWWLDVG